MERYESIGAGYARYRQPDGSIARAIRAAIGDARSMVNVGAGAGSYEPVDLLVTAVDSSRAMLAQRPPACALRAAAEHLPLRDGAFDVALAVLTIHHWRDLDKGLREMTRVSRRRAVIFTWDPEHPGFWLTRDYLPEILEWDRRLFPTLTHVESLLGKCRTEIVPIPALCLDGFLGAYWQRPSTYLDPDARRAISTFSRLTHAEVGLARLRVDLEDGSWFAKNREIAELREMDLGYRLLVCERP